MEEVCNYGAVISIHRSPTKDVLNTESKTQASYDVKKWRGVETGSLPYGLLAGGEKALSGSKTQSK